MAKHGKKIFISTDGTNVIAGTKSNKLSVEDNLIEIASATQGQWEEYITGRKTWSMTASFLLMSIKPSNPFNPLNVGQTYTLTFMDQDNPSDMVSGQAILQKCDIDSVTGNLCNGSVTFRGVGALT